MVSLDTLPYDLNALEPSLSRNNLDLHYTKHHAGYVHRVKNLTRGTWLANLTLGELLTTTSAQETGLQIEIFNNASQVWNHDFYWRSMSPVVVKPSTQLKQFIELFALSSQQTLDQVFIHEGMKFIGSGWLWIGMTIENQLTLITTTNTSRPNLDTFHPLLVCDLWEHAYYPTFNYRKEEYLLAFINTLANWEFAADQLRRWLS